MTYFNAAPPLQEASNHAVRARYYVIPRWIYDNFTHSYSLSEIHEYGKLRKVTSVSDLAELEIYSRSLFSDTCLANLEFYGLSSFVYDDVESSVPVDMPKLTDDERNEVKFTIGSLINSEAVRHQALNRLRSISSPNGALGDCYAVDSFGNFPQSSVGEEKLPYEIVVREDCIYIIVEEGFISFFEKGPERLTFLRDVLKEAYKIFPYKQVNCSIWFIRYLQALRA